MTSFGSVCVLLLQILAVQSVVQNVTRYEPDGDIFSNPDTSCISNFCQKYKGITVRGSQADNCKCSCAYHNTFVVHNTTCVRNEQVQTSLVASLQAKDALFRVTQEDTNCMSYIGPAMPVLDITRQGTRKLCLTKTDITKCNIIQRDSKYFYEGKWYQIWPTNRKQDTFDITEDEDDSFLEWTSLGQQFTGLIFALKISCGIKGSSSDMDMTDTFPSYFIFKSAGSHYFNGDKPTFAPISVASTSESNGLSPTPQTSTTASPSKSGKGMNSSKSNDEGLIAGVTIAVILVLIVIIVVVVFYVRRKRNNNEKPPEQAKSEANPTYEVGQDRTLPVTVNGQPPTYDSPDSSGRYQPLVQNTRMRDASGQVPVYTPLNKQTKNNNSPVIQMKTPSKGSLAYETVAIPIQQAATNDPGLAESPDYEDPTNPTNPHNGGLYAVSTPQDNNTIDFENTTYSDPDSVIPIN